MSELLTPKEIAQIIKKSVWTVRRYVQKYCIPSYSGNRFKLDEFLEAIKEQPKQQIVVKKSFPLRSKNKKYREVLGV